MLLTSAASPPAGDGWVHEAKLDGWRCLVEVSGSRVQVSSRRGGDYTTRLHELQSLSGVGDVLLDGELVVITDDGRADFELLSTRVNGRNRRPTSEPPVTLYAFDVLRHKGRNLCGEPWTVRPAILEQLDLAAATSGVVRTVSYTRDRVAMHQATLALGADLSTGWKKCGSGFSSASTWSPCFTTPKPGSPVRLRRCRERWAWCSFYGVNRNVLNAMACVSASFAVPV
jgi:bifunctional non-homologous end joining protein LigD